MDHQQRKEQIAEAAWRIIRQEGLEGVSVRRVADEADVSLGSLRHYFPTQNELLFFTMQLVTERVQQRIRSLPFTGEPRADIEMAITELAPLDDERRAEAKVWLAFAGKAISDPAIREISRQVHEALYDGFRGMIELLVSERLTKEGLDPERETRRLHALVDGLVVHGVTYPERMSGQELMRIIADHLDGLLAESPSPSAERD
ncbi:TetR family transcriptional regulator C-terminal domain-containing protein [Cohnella sp. REN36]|uniref:TetR/AcrR family transcriptional regulator n=1 Tax=Cohnella sp. REN36 TaxID=2887347 RepID=UPI001D14915E|nr:TetR family transcriptional regulator C-terminal domain-containing protein [Cohnella sp. REN36]